jgi:transcriptional regulator with XRE-family HTH domain
MRATAPVINPGNTQMARLIVRLDQLRKFRTLIPGMETDAAFAERIGVNPGQVSRIRQGKNNPGPKFIAGVLDLFGIEFFSDLFAVVPDDDHLTRGE